MNYTLNFVICTYFYITILIFLKYVTETFRTDAILNPEYHRFFRVVPAAQVSSLIQTTNLTVGCFTENVDDTLIKK